MIELRSLTKHFKNHQAVKEISLRIEKGDAFGFIGPNGAGKTTTIKMMATLLPPTSGEMYIDGISVTEEPEKVREVIGYMPDHFGVYDGMKVGEYLDFFAAAFRKSKNERKRLIGDVLELTDLTGLKESPIEVLSTGMKQRLCLAKTLLHDPKVLILDEPASGLDPRARIELKVLLKELSTMGKTIFISSHILPELADYCNKIGIIEKGSLIACGSVQSIIEKTRTMASYKIRVLGDTVRAAAMLKEDPMVGEVEEVNGHLRFSWQGEKDSIAGLIEALVMKKAGLLGIWEEETNLEDVFMQITKGDMA
ncbi:MAG: ABC transporter ATP-binding protein [Candidatus Eremiobacteraeota bacterium]|nr:ABC transporter ATP-binding protein [Candidatus Eremiobacteraeota bacterium]